jgi:Prophage minor tail protein Z (GPZ)
LEIKGGSIVEIKIDMNNKKVLQHLTALRGAHTNVKVRSLNRIAKSARTAASADIRKRVNIKKKDLDSKIVFHGAKFDKPVARLTTRSKSKGVALFKYGGRKGTKRRGASFMVKKGHRSYIPRGFVATVKSSKGGPHTNIFVRVGKSRLPIKQKFGPSVAKLMGSKRIKRVIDKHIGKNWIKEFESAMKFYLNRR